MNKLDPNVYREAAAFLAVDPSDRNKAWKTKTKGMCTCLYWYFQSDTSPEVSLKEKCYLGDQYAGALAAVFKHDDRHVFWWDSGDINETAQMERFMAMHFMAEMLENP